MGVQDRPRGPVERAIRKSISPGLVLHTPSRGAPFKVSKIDETGVVLLLGKGQWATRLTWDCLERVPHFIRELGGTIPIGGRHEVQGNPGTLDELLKSCVKRTTAGWVAVLLEEAELVEIIHERPAMVQLRHLKPEPPVR